MKLSEITPLLEQTFGEGKVRYRAFPEDAAALCPFCVWQIEETRNFFAGNIVAAEISGVRIDIVTTLVTPALENALEGELEAINQPWTKSAPDYDPTEQVYITSYTFEVLNDGT